MNDRRPKYRTREPAAAPALAILALACASLVAGCAPDSVRSVQATGFNGWFKSLPTVCKPLIVGSADMGPRIMNNDMGDNDYAYFMDNTSRLYYNRLSPASYRQAIEGIMGPGSYNDASFACIVRSLPPDRPSAPPGTF